MVQAPTTPKNNPAPPSGEPPRGSRGYGVVASLKKTLSRTFSRTSLTRKPFLQSNAYDPSASYDGKDETNRTIPTTPKVATTPKGGHLLSVSSTPKAKHNSLFKVNNDINGDKTLIANGDASSGSTMPPAAPSCDPTPSQPETSGVSAKSPSRSQKLSKSGTLLASVSEDISAVFKQAEAELDQMNDKYGRSFCSGSFSFVSNISGGSPAKGESLASSASFESGSIEVLERSMREREEELRGLLYRTQQRLRDRLDITDFDDDVDTEETANLLRELDEKSPPSVARKEETPKNKTPKNNTGSPSLGAEERTSSVQLWHDAYNYVNQALQFSGSLRNVHEYFEQHNLHVVCRSLLLTLLKEQPEDPWAFAASFLERHSEDPCSPSNPCSPNQKMRYAAIPEHEPAVVFEENAISACIDRNETIDRDTLKAYVEKHDLTKSVQVAISNVGRVQPKEPLIWLKEFFLCRLGKETGSLVPDWVQVRAPDGSVYWVDLVAGGVQTEKPKEAEGSPDEIWENSDATAMQAVIRDLRRGNIQPEDASEWVRMKFLKKVRLMNCVLRRDAHVTPGWEGTLRESDNRTLKDLEKYIHVGYGADKTLLQEVSKVDVVALRMLKRVFSSFAESSADQIDHASISRSRFLELLEDLELIEPEAGSDKPFSLDSTLGEKFLRKGDELTKKDAEAIFDLIAAGIAGAEPQCNVVNPEMYFFGFLVSLHMIAKRTRRPLNDVLADITFSNISLAHRPAFAAMSNKGITRRVHEVFKRFTGGKKSGQQ